MPAHVPGGAHVALAPTAPFRVSLEASDVTPCR